MSCLFKLFKNKNKKKEKEPPPPHILHHVQNERYSISFGGPLPSSVEDLRILEYEIGRKMSYLNGKSARLYSNASHCQNKGDIKKALLYIRQRKPIVDDISKLSARLSEVQLSIDTIGPKIEVASPLNVLQAK
jgi:hypothetical protein